MEPEDVAKLAFDGVYRPEPWLSDDRWRAVAYTQIRLSTGRTQAERRMDNAVFKDRQRAQAHCDALNATRMDVSKRSQPLPRLI